MGQTNAMSIADLIKAGRKRLGWTQRELARRMEVKPSAVAQWELGATKPTMKKRADLSRLLGVPFVQMLPELGATGTGDIEDAEILAILEQLLELPRPIRQGLLMSAAATLEHLRTQR